MTVEVRYTDFRFGKHGEERVEEFETERRASIFMDGLKAREDVSFDGVVSGHQPSPDDEEVRTDYVPVWARNPRPGADFR